MRPLVATSGSSGHSKDTASHNLSVHDYDKNWIARGTGERVIGVKSVHWQTEFGVVSFSFRLSTLQSADQWRFAIGMSST